MFGLSLILRLVPKRVPIRFASGWERGFCPFGQRGKANLVVYRHIRQHLPIQYDIRPVQPIDKAAIAQLMDPGGSVDPNDPQSPELTLPLTSVAIGVLVSLHNGLVGNPEDIFAGSAIALGA